MEYKFSSLTLYQRGCAWLDKQNSNYSRVPSLLIIKVTSDTYQKLIGVDDYMTRILSARRYV